MKKNNIDNIIQDLKKHYPDAKCSLNFTTPFELLIAVVLSAQCTDERVNKVTPILFNIANTPKQIAELPINEFETLIHSCGFYKNKAKNLKNTAQILCEKYNENVPNTMEELLTLPGVGRKSANVILLEAFNKPQGIAVDTHAKRLSNRIGFSENSDPLKIEQDLLKIISKKHIRDLNHLLMYHGRAICTSQNPKCNQCPIQMNCKTYINKTI